jgi:hypothetical protein
VVLKTAPTSFLGGGLVFRLSLGIQVTLDRFTASGRQLVFKTAPAGSLCGVRPACLRDCRLGRFCGVQPAWSLGPPFRLFFFERDPRPWGNPYTWSRWTASSRLRPANGLQDRAGWFRFAACPAGGVLKTASRPFFFLRGIGFFWATEKTGDAGSLHGVQPACLRDCRLARFAVAQPAWS